MRKVFFNGQIFTPTGYVHGGFVVKDGLFEEIFTGNMRGEVDLGGCKVLPGLIDIHIHGAVGADFSDGEETGLISMARYLAAQGITAFCPTSMTLPYETLERAYTMAARLAKSVQTGCARIAGIHMEGPFFSQKRAGAQNPSYLRLPDFCAFETLRRAAGGLLRQADVAAELPGGIEFAKKASKLTTVSLAHTDCTYEQADAFFEAGATHVTHLFNAMPGIHHRHPGPIGAASERENVMAELICDGLHVHPSAVRLAFKLFPHRICLISDALRCLGMGDGVYTLGGQQVYLQGRLATLSDGTIAGSVTHLFDCMKKAVSFGIPENEAVLAATARPAVSLGLEKEIGSIAPGRHADFVLCTDALERLAVYMSGEKL